MKLKENQVKVMFFQNAKREPAVCLAFEVTSFFQQENEYMVSCAWAVKHSTDRPSRRIARRVALGRLNGDKSALQFKAREGDDFFSVLRQVAAAIFKSGPAFDPKEQEATAKRMLDAGYDLDAAALPKKLPSELKRALRQFIKPRKFAAVESTDPA